MTDFINNWRRQEKRDKEKLEELQELRSSAKDDEKRQEIQSEIDLFFNPDLIYAGKKRKKKPKKRKLVMIDETMMEW